MPCQTTRHVLIHSPHFGVPAVVGGLIGLWVGWPELHGDLTAHQSHEVSRGSPPRAVHTVCHEPAGTAGAVAGKTKIGRL